MDGDMAVFGLTEYAPETLGDIVFIELPEVGSTIDKGEPFGVIESVKAASDIYAPVGGTVDKAICSAGMPTACEYAVLMACYTNNSGVTFQASLAVALALCAPSSCSMPASDMILFDSAASTNERCILMSRYNTLYCGS